MELYQDETKNLDVPLSNGEIVSINLIDELPEDSNELISFLENEQCPGKYWISISQAYCNINKLDEGKSIIEQALSKNFSTNEIQQFERYLAWLNLKLAKKGIDKIDNLTKVKNFIESIQDFEVNDNNLQVLLIKATYYLFNNQETQALKEFEKILTIDETNCFAMLGKAEILMKHKKDYGSILKLYQQVLLLNPIIKPDPRIGIGLCFWYLKDHKMAIRSWERSLQLDGNNLNVKILLNLSKFNDTFNHSLSDKEFKANYNHCLKTLKSNYDVDNENPVILLTFVSYYFTKKNYELVEKICNKIIGKVTSQTVEGLNNYQKNLLSQASFWLGRCYYNKQDFIQSQRLFHESIRFDDDNLLSKLGLGQSQISRNLIQEAINTFENLMKKYPKNLEINYCLGLLYSRSKSKKRLESSISILERYINLCQNRGINTNDEDEDSMTLDKEPIILNAYLILSKLYESKDINQSLNYLNKAVESRKAINKDIPLEIYNNIGVFNFNKGNNELAVKNFQLALDNLNTIGIKRFDKQPEQIEDLVKDLKIVLDYNLARSLESSDKDQSLTIYENISKSSPNYFSSKLRSLFLNLVSTNNLTVEQVKEEIEIILNLSPENLEIRSFYSWFIKTFGKKIGLKTDDDTEHQKETLVSYNSHDCYALVSLANIYCIMAKELKSSDDKRKKYYIRAIELFTKVLSIDSKNVYGAQGLALVYIENGELLKGLDILRKIRDSLNELSIYLNLGHVLLELKQYTKAIENYEIALNKFSNNDSNILTFLGKAWLLRGMNDKSLQFLNKSLDYSKQSLTTSSGNSKTINSLKFNISYVQYQIADYLIKLPVSERKIRDIEFGIKEINEGIEILNELSSDDEKNSPYSKTDLKTRTNLGNTLLNRLNQSLQETKDFNEAIDDKLQKALEVRQQELAKQQELEEARQLEKAKLEEETAKERIKLQEQAQQWAEEKALVVEDDDKLFDEEVKDEEKKKSDGKKKKGKKGRRKKDVIEDSEEEAEEPEEPEAEEPEPQTQPEEPQDDEIDPDLQKPKKKFKSDEFVRDSDDDDDLF
ncbi:RNA polymerase-associated protein Ctr9p [[Candida] jaroonii]|uniref:RNA polymerase-associated protein Ctr9p n=1 Tax=[Candida] jaroonii TaxID=467808 RepID=A0ACA9Y1Z2_9ASCO|nr:RNA polymerase-associated protein Ctr9p [[Candida] jaroonii]